MSQSKLRLAYLTTLYPALSHTFVEREIRELREQGCDIRTFSVRRPALRDRLGVRNRDAERETYYLLDHSMKIPLAFLIALVTRPVSLVRTLIFAQRLSPPTPVARFKHLAYALEAVTMALKMKREGLRHVHVHLGNNGASVALLAGVFYPALSYSLSVHGPGEFSETDRHLLKSRAEYALFVRCISDFCKSQVMARTDSSAWKNFHVVHCGIDPEIFSANPEKHKGPLQLIAVGRLVQAKGFPILLQACAALGKEGVDWKLDVVGAGDLMENLQHLAVTLGITDRVTFAGPVAPEQVVFRMQQADILVLPSFQEGVPIVLMEAMAMELPVVSTTVAGIPELVESGKEGWLVHPGSVEALSGALKTLADDKALRAKLGKAARKKVVAQFAITKVSSQMKELFASYLQ